MKKLALLIASVALIAAPCSSAFADTFNFGFSGPDFAATGTFDATAMGPAGEFIGSSITGEALIGGTVYDITGFDPVNTYLGNDNLFYTGSLDYGFPFDFDGFAFTLDNGDSITLFSENGTDQEILGNTAADSIQLNDTADISFGSGVGTNNVTPEPETLTLLGTGMLGLAGLIRRRLNA